MCIVCLTHLFPIHPFSTPLKTSESLAVFKCFQGGKGALGTNELKGCSGKYSPI